MIRMFSQYVSAKTIVLMVLRTLLVALSFAFGARLRFWNDPAQFSEYFRWPDSFFQMALVLTVFQVCFYYSDLYKFNGRSRQSELIVCVGQALGAGSLVLGLAYYIFPSLLIGRGVFFVSTALAGTTVLVSHIILNRAWGVAWQGDAALIVGTGRVAASVARELKGRDDLYCRLVGFVEPAGTNVDTILNYPVLGHAGEITKLVREHHITRIIVALEDQRGMLPIGDLVKLRVEGIWIEDAQSAMAALTGRVWLDTVRPSWFVFSNGFRRSVVTIAIKRVVDLTFGLLGLLISLPAMILIAILIRLDSKGPAIFRQERVGLRGETFELLKFRSMRVDAEQISGAQWAQKDDPRSTRLGRYLRKFRLDELPQFINVIRGDMSFVGPRPERPVFVEQLRKAISYYDERHSVRPGITGWAQVKYPYGASVEDAFHKLEYDLFYLKNMSIWFDLLVILHTIRIVLTGNGSR